MTFTGRWFIFYGAFLFLCGLAGYLSNPEAAKTALISGSVFGGLSAVWGFLMQKQLRPAWWGALVTCAMLAAVFTWRSIVSWTAVKDGDDKTFAAALITLMLFATIAAILLLLKRGRST
jgi:uncharacterized membrane protein (UPF0136 family)